MSKYPKPLKLYENLDLLPGRLSLHKYENKLAERWNGSYQGDNLSLRTITNIRRISEEYTNSFHYDYVLIDTSPSLGILNKTIISTVDGFFIPAQPDIFSLYGMRNIGNSLEIWQKDFETIYSLISEDKRKRLFPKKFVQFLGYTVYNAKPSTNKTLNEYGLAKAHYSYVQEIPEIIDKFINKSNRAAVGDDIMKPLGGTDIIHSHNTFPSVAQALKCPIWMIPDVYKEYIGEIEVDYNTGHNSKCREIGDKYRSFARRFIERTEVL